MEESEDNMSAEEIKLDDVPIKVKPKKRSLVERELETSLTARITSPITNGESSSTSRYGRARRLKSDADFCDLEKNVSILHKSPKLDKSPSKVQSPAYKMHASNSPVRIETPKRESNLENQIENIYNENNSLSRFGSEEKACKSATKKFPKVYIRKDLIQSKDKDDDTVVLIKNMFSPSNSAKKPGTHLANYMERSSEKYNMKKSMNGYLNTSSVVKTLDFDNKKKKKEEKKTVLSKSELFDLEAQCEYQVGDLTWARLGTYPFWPCIITRDPYSGMFVKKKLFGRIERDVLHVTFFGDNGRRGWIVGSMLRKFLGQKEFEVARANFPPETKKKDPKLYAAFFITDKKIPQWQISVNEAEMFLREPKRLRIDILNDMLQNGREMKTTSNQHEKSKAIVRTNSDVSLSESLLDTLFSEDDSKGNDVDRSRSKSRNRSFDVSEVVTACLDNMAAKTGITKIQRQSHMDRWLQKAKSKTPEKSHLKSHLSLKIEKDNKVSKPINIKKKLPKTSPANKHYNCRKIVTESQSEIKLLPHQNEHDYSLRYRESNGPVLLDNCEIEYENAEMLTSDVIEPGSGLGFISKVETLCGQERVENNEQNNEQNDVVMTISNEEFTISDTNDISNMNVENQICIQNNHGKSLDVNNEVVLEKENYMTSLYTSDSGIMQINKTIEKTKLETLKTIEAKKTENDETFSISSIEDTHIATLKDLDYDGSDKIVLDGKNIDNEFSNECDTHIKTINNESDNNLVIFVDQKISLMDVTIETEIVTEHKNGSISKKQGTVSIIKQESSLNLVNSLDSDIVETVTSEKKTALKENLFKNNEVLKEYICSEIKTLSNIANLKDDEIGENPEVSTNISDENSKQASVMKENLLQNKELELNDLSENNENNLSKQSVEVSNIHSMKTYADNEKNFFPDIPNNTGEKTTGHTTSNEKIVIQENFVPNELNSNTSSGNKTINTQIPEIPYVTNANKCVDDEIDRFATDPENSNNETEIKKDLILNIMSNPSIEKTSLSTMSLDVVNLNEYTDKRIENLPEKSNNILVKKNFEQTNPEKETFTDKYLSINQNLDSNSSTVNKLSNSVTLNSEVSNPNIKGDVDGIEDFPDPSKTTEEKSSMECEILNKEIIEENLLLDKDLISQSLEVSKVTNLKEYVDESIENLFDISAKKSKAEQSTPCKEAVLKKKLSQNKELKSKTSNTARKIANRSTKKLKVTNVVMGSKEYGIGAFPNVSTNTGQNNQILESKSLRQNERELKEFETQLYSIFGLKNEKSPKCQLNLSHNNSCKKSSSTDVIKPIDNTVQIDVDDEPECTSKVQENEIKKSVENDDASVNVMNVRPDVRTICIQRENSKDIVVNIESATSFEKTVENMAKNDIIASETKGRNFHTACDMDIQTSSKENLKKNAFNNADLQKEPVVEGYTDNTLEVDDNDTIEKNVMSSKDNKTSPQKINLPDDHKLSYDIKALKNPDFVKYLELRQDALVDEQPELTQVEITNYLYKTWLYEENLKAISSDIKKTDDIQNVTLVNGLKYSPIKIKLSLNKSSRSNKKSYKVEITNDNENNDNSSFSRIDQKIELNDNKNKNLLNQTESSPKRSKRLKQSNHYSTSFQKYFISSIKKDSHSNKVLELIPKECQIQENDNYPVKIEINAHVDTTCTDSASVSSNLSIQNGYNNVQIGKKLHCPNKTDSIKNQSPKVSGLVTQNGCHEVKLNAKRASLDGIDADKNFICDDEEPLAAQQRLTFSKNQSACIADGETRINTTEFKEEIEDDTENVSVKSEISDNLHLTKKLHTQDKHSSDKRIPLEEPEFKQYLELKQDTLIDEHPELTKEEITNYLYKIWLYEENSKNDSKKEDIETTTNLVEVLNQETAPVKRVRKKKVEKDKPIEFNLDSENMTRKEKSKRKIIKPYFYKEHFSDIEDDIEFFEIFKNTSKMPTSDSFKIDATEKRSSDDQMIIDANVDAEFVTNEMDEAEEYFRQLTVPKPNLFKGLVREKVCEICEKIYNLIKCKGCHCMFHVDCVKKKFEVVETAITVRGRKKKKKTRGRKAKDHSNSLDSECQSDEKSQDLNASDEMLNTSVENKIDPLVIANADDFEAQLSVKLKELLENPENKEYESFSSADELDWNDIDYGECKVVDVLPRKKDSKIDYANFKCNNCEQYDTPVCFVCKSALSPKDKAEHRQRCQVPHCHKYYHLECLDHWPQTQFNAGELSRTNKSNQLVEALTCPRHVCHTCVCDDPRGCKTRFSGDKLARCVRCPATYHTFTKCLPAGTQILTGSHIICPRHYEHRPGKVPCHVNTGWCFICALGGTLICCEYCPTSFHAECLNIDPPEGGYMCEDCETGRLPLYGEMVWVKLGHYRWWPGMILHPSEIPPNILAVKHLQGEFVVRFFGQYDYYWVNRGRVFPFQEGDSGRISGQKSKIDAAFTMAMEHAQRACEILKTAPPNEEESMDIASSLLPPHYVKLKVNKPCGSLCGKKIDIEESSLTQCECDPNEFDPCGPYTQCLNRMLLTECGPTCRAGDRCNNRAFEKRLYPKMTPYRTPHRGWGLKTLEDIKAGQFVIEYVGELIDEEEFRRRMRRKQEVRDENFYYLTLDKERMIDAGPKGNLARFMNHSCEPNCETQKWTVLGDVRVGLFALFDIPANSELTFNYNLESTGIEKKQCMCGAKRCSGYIGEKPKQDDQPKKTKPGLPTKRTYKKRKNIEISPSPKPKQRAPRPYKPRELTEIEKDLLIIKNATNGMSSDSESSRLSIDSKDSKGLKRRRAEDTLSPSTKKFKTEKAIEENDGKYQEVLTEK